MTFDYREPPRVEPTPDGGSNPDSGTWPEGLSPPDSGPTPDGGSNPDSGGVVTHSQITECSDPTEHNANPDNFFFIAERTSEGCHRINMEPGQYMESDLPRLGNVTLRCTERHECFVNGWHIGRYETLVVEGMTFGALDNDSGNNYGLALYYGNQARLQDNVWETADSVNQTHGLSIKNTAERVEVLNNRFNCLRHCIEISQNGNIRTRNSLTGTMLISGNAFTSKITVITNRNSCEVIIDDNDFVSVGSTAITNLPFWELYPFGPTDDDNGELYVPKCPYPQDQATGTITRLSTRVTNNRFSGGQLDFHGRGVIDDTVYLEGNSGPFSCELSSMGSGARDATVDEQTTEPPQLADRSDPC